MHGQLMIGEQTLYLSHLPMFMFNPAKHPHNFQVILEVSLSQSGADPLATYQQDRQQHPDQRVYTLAPEPFEMDRLVLTVPEQRLASFRGELFRGHFERGGTSILRDVTVTVQNVVCFRPFDPQAAALPDLEYIVFGKGEVRFLSHVITKPPDFDQILTVRAIQGHSFSDGELGRGPRVVFPAEPGTDSRRLREGQTLRGDLLLEGNAAGQRLHVEVQTGIEIYHETDDLAHAMD
jgi:hypothetical protein